MRFVVGQRLDIEEYKATIRFVGQIPPADTIWLGVEWDDPDRGKHSGEHKGTSYFTVRVPGSASFIKANLKNIRTGRDFIEALRERYLMKGDKIEDIEVSLGPGTKKAIETVGWDKIYKKQKRLDTLREVGLKDMLIDRRRTEKGSIKETCGAIQDLDLSRNLFESWEHVAEICIELEQLESLRLNFCRFTPMNNLPQDLTNAFAHIKILGINRTFLRWKDIQALEPHLPSLEELHAGHNDIDSFTDSVDGFKKLLLLNIEGNLIKSWDEVRKLRILPSLQNLMLNDNQLEGVDPVTDYTEFISLKTINLNSNKITSWNSVHNLNSFPALLEIRLKLNPVTDSIEELDKRAIFLLARLCKVTRLNGSSISEKRRNDAEIYYLDNACARDKADLPKEEFEKRHPLYPHLVKKHGEPELPSDKVLNKTIKDGLLSLRFIKGDEEITKGVPHKMKIRALKSLISRLFKTARVELVAKMADGRDVELNDELRDLYFYSIEDDDVIHVKNA